MDSLIAINWIVLGQIILIDILLGGDNAIVIALACRNLPPHLRFKGIVWGTVGAIVIRITLIAFAVTLLQVPFLKCLGGLLLLWIGIKLLAETDDDHSTIQASDRLFTAIKTIVVADLVMSIDNVIAVASATEQADVDHQLALIIFGITFSIPIIVWGSTIVLKLMERFPVIITLGSGLLGYLAGGMIFTDTGLVALFAPHFTHPNLPIAMLGVSLSIPSSICAVGVVIIGKYLARQNQ